MVATESWPDEPSAIETCPRPAPRMTPGVAWPGGRQATLRPRECALVRELEPWVVVGLDNGGNKNNATVLDPATRVFLVDDMIETPSRVQEGPEVAVEALAAAFDDVLRRTGIPRERVRVVGFDSPGPASASGIISQRGSTNFGAPAWWGFDFRGALEARLRLPVVYSNDGNAAALYAHHVYFGADAPVRSSVSAIVGTGLGGGLIERGRIITGATGMAGELGHVHIPMDGLLADGQPVPRCNCGAYGDAESVASLTGIENNLLPYWLTRFEGHPLGKPGLPGRAALLVRSYAERQDPMALEIGRASCRECPSKCRSRWSPYH